MHIYLHYPRLRIVFCSWPSIICFLSTKRVEILVFNASISLQQLEKVCLCSAYYDWQILMSQNALVLIQAGCDDFYYIATQLNKVKDIPIKLCAAFCLRHYSFPNLPHQIRLQHAWSPFFVPLSICKFAPTSLVSFLLL